MQQLSLNLGILPQISQTTVDPYWGEEPQNENKFQVGDRVEEMVSEFNTVPRLGIVAAIDDGRHFIRWEPVNGESCGGSYINAKYLRLAAHQQVSPCQSVSEQVNNVTDLQPHKNCSLTHFVEKYWVPRGDKKYYYFRYTWMEGRKMHRKYIGSCTNPKARERVEMVKSAIALGKFPHEIVEILK